METLKDINAKYGWILAVIAIPTLVKNLSWWAGLILFIISHAPDWTIYIINIVGSLIGPVLETYRLFANWIFSFLPFTVPEWLSLIFPPALSIFLSDYHALKYGNEMYESEEDRRERRSLGYSKAAGGKEKIDVVRSKFLRSRRMKRLLKFAESNITYLNLEDEIQKGLNAYLLTMRRLHLRQIWMSKVFKVIFGGLLLSEVLYRLFTSFS